MAWLGRKEFEYENLYCEDMKVVVWEKENPQVEDEKHAISIENNNKNDDFWFETLEDAKLAVEHLQKAIAYIEREG